MKIFNKIKQRASKLTNKFKPQSNIIQICERVYHCPYPTTDIKNLIQLKNNIQPQQIQIWNLSEYQYTKQIYDKLINTGFTITQITYQFYSSMPLTTSITSIIKIQKYLVNSQHNYIIFHCQQNKSRSILFLTAYLYLTQQYIDIATALAYVNQKLGIQSNQTVYSSQHYVLRNIANYHRDPQFINKQCVKLLKIIINQAPRLPEISVVSEEQSLKMLLEIRRNGKVVYKKLTKQFGMGQIVQFDIKNQQIILSDDCLFSFKYVYREKIYPVMRIQINTNFIFNNFLRVQMQEIDFTHNVTKSNGHIFTDFLFSTVKDQQTQLSKLKVGQIINGNGNINIKGESRKKSMQKKEIARLSPLHGKTGVQNDKKLQGNSQVTSKNQVETKKNNVVQKDAFNIIDERQKQQYDEKVTEQKLNKLLASMAKNKAELEQHRKQAQKQDQQFNKIQQQNHEKDKQQQQKQQSLNKNNKQQGNENNANQQVKKQQNSNNENQQQQNKVNQTNSKLGKAKSNTKIQDDLQEQEQEQGDVDIDDYLNKLEQQADQN